MKLTIRLQNIHKNCRIHWNWRLYETITNYVIFFVPRCVPFRWSWSRFTNMRTIIFILPSIIATATERLTNQQLFHVHFWWRIPAFASDKYLLKLLLQIWKETTKKKNSPQKQHKVIYSEYGCYSVAMIRNKVLLSVFELWFYELWQFFFHFFIHFLFSLPGQTMFTCLWNSAIIFLREKS